MRRSRWPLGLFLAVVIAGALSPWASSLPDGLEWTATRLGFSHREAENPVVAAPMVDYTVTSVPDTRWSRAAAGVTGTVVVFAAASLFGFVATRLRRGRTPEE